MLKTTNSKFGLPSAKHITRREGLLCQLASVSMDNQVATGSVVCCWIWGPSGSGKTSLIASYVEGLPGESIWYRVGPDDVDLNTFISNIHQATNQDYKPPAPPINFPVTISRFFIELDQQLEKQTLWVWDNCDCLAADHPLFGVFAQLLDYPLQNLRIVFASRHAPPASFMRLQLGSTMNIIDWSMLRLSVAEAQAIAAQRMDKPLPINNVNAMHALSDGWVALFVLLLQSGMTTKDKYSSAEGQALFNYLAAEVISGLEPKLQKFLLDIAIVPYCTPEIATALATENEAIDQLEQLASQLHLVERIAGPDPIYRFHSLLTDYSHKVLQSELSAQAYRQTVIRGAGILVQHQHTEPAAGLYLSVADWDSLSQLCLLHAESLVAKGQLSKLRYWLDNLPDSYAQQNVWLAYWQASGARYNNYESSLTQLEEVFNRFKEQRNAKGQYMTWLLIVESIALSFDDLKPLKHWLKEYDQLRVRHPRCPGIELRLKVFALAAGVMSMVQPAHPRLQKLIRICQMGVFMVPLKEPRAGILAYLAFHYLSGGEIARLSAISKHLVPALTDVSLAKPVRLLSHAMLGFHQLIAGRQQPQQFLDDGMAIALPGEAFFSTVHAYRIYCDAMELRLQSATSLLEDFASNIPHRQRMDLSHHDFMLAWISALEGDFGKAFAQAQLAKGLAKTLGFDFGVMLNCNLCAQLAVLLNRFDDAEIELAEVAAYSSATQSQLARIMLALSSAWLKTRQSGSLVGVSDIEGAFKLAEVEGVLAYPGFMHSVAAEMALVLVRHNKSTPFVRTLVRRWNLTPSVPYQDLREWPWRVSIQTLGRFSLQLDSKVVDLSKRSNRRVVEFLQQLIALGGINVSKSKLGNVLWPDSDGDKASHALDNVLYRARKLLGADMLLIQNGQVSLNAAFCWIDSWALQTIKSDETTSVIDLGSNTSQLMMIYEGEFLPGILEGGVVTSRERLRGEFLAKVNDLGQQFLQRGFAEQAVELWQQALDREPYHEPLYMQLAKHYIDSGRFSEAKHVYQHCRQVLSTAYNTSPSRAFQTLAEQISG